MNEKPALLSDTTVNCCNGRVGKRMLDLAVENEKLARLVMPTGVELVRAAISAGIAAKDTVNCCNGRVGNQMNLQEIVKSFGSGLEAE
jgi:hypothetical protein